MIRFLFLLYTLQKHKNHHRPTEIFRGIQKLQSCPPTYNIGSGIVRLRLNKYLRLLNTYSALAKVTYHHMHLLAASNHEL